MKQLLTAIVLALFSGMALATVNLNTASKDDLVALPGIGPAKAQAIIDYRKTHGSFKTIEELKDVKGIGAKRYEKLKAEVSVSGASSKPTTASKADAAASVASAKVKP